ncbi:hypothetical protein GBF38_009652 [Nibea albiflora]|uniref:Uncharacterized protein n=1 Tax=Nibea albiflora TaxID=240163 RepID=A0ACB7F9F1_NIBAL|nr:hypothetical protein GBF38_009652 [Nibea albiflora]
MLLARNNTFRSYRLTFERQPRTAEQIWNELNRCKGFPEDCLRLTAEPPEYLIEDCLHLAGKPPEDLIEDCPHPVAKPHEDIIEDCPRLFILKKATANGETPAFGRLMVELHHSLSESGIDFSARNETNLEHWSSPDLCSLLVMSA